MLTTYLLRLASEPSAALTGFIERVHSIESPDGTKPATSYQSNIQEEIEP